MGKIFSKFQKYLGKCDFSFALNLWKLNLKFQEYFRKILGRLEKLRKGENNLRVTEKILKNLE